MVLGRLLLLAFFLSAALELYFFMMQRSALQISRAADISPRDGRYMLPFWYLWHWPARIIKWATAISIGFLVNWGMAVAMLMIPFCLMLLVPIPHQHFIPLFRRKVRSDVEFGENSELSLLLDSILEEAQSE